MKYAYRQAVKTCHPDRNPNADKTMNDHFIEITKQYERLLELYEARQRDSAS
jgi:DnaJ-class molecular chaperone